MRYVLGLDIGIASVGWAVLNLEMKRIENLGVRAFSAAENPKNGSALAEPRRLARCARGRLRRRAGRLRRAKDLFVQYRLVSTDRRDTAFLTGRETASPWDLRVDGLDRLLSGEEFARALFHIAKRRGFKSTRKTVADKSDEGGKMLTSIAGNKRAMAAGGYRTAGEMLSLDTRFVERKRNTSGEYGNTVDRGMLEDEIRELFRAQRGLDNRFAGEDFEEEFLEVFLWQKPFASGDDILRKVGTCAFENRVRGCENDEPRAPKRSYATERFNLLSTINKLTYLSGGDRAFLTQEQREAVAALAYQKTKVTYAQVRKTAGLPEDARFPGLRYRADDDAVVDVAACEKGPFVSLDGYHSLRKTLDARGVWGRVGGNPALMDDLAYALTFFKTDEDIRRCLEERGVEEDVIDAALYCEGFSGTSHLSALALGKIIPFLEEGMLYSDACAAAGYNHSGREDGVRSTKLPPIDRGVTTNPVVLRALTQARKVVNAVVDRYGSPHRVHIELARDMSRPADERKEIQRKQNENFEARKRADEQFRETFEREPNGGDILKWRLYEEQGGQCAYSLQPLDIAELFRPHYVEVDHILPYSRTFDDSRSNKALVLGSENQRKGNRTPREAFGANDGRWTRFEAWVHATIRDPKKRNNLLRKSLDQRQEDEWKERCLNDTRSIAREFAAFVRDNLAFDNDEGKQVVVCVNGQMTALVRRLWGLSKDRSENDLHHALDAAVVAAVLPHDIKNLVTAFATVVETGGQYVDRATGEVIEWNDERRPRLPFPWKQFRRELQARLSENPAEAISQLGLPCYEGAPPCAPVMVSRMPHRRVSGPIHDETIRSPRGFDEDGKPISVVRKRLTALTPDDLTKLYAPETNAKLYSAIRERLAPYGKAKDAAARAFAEPLRKPTNDGSPGPIVSSVKVCQTQMTGVPVRGGIADNGGIARLDVSRVCDAKGRYKYYSTPVYISDVMSRRLPDAPGEFLFSLYSHDLMEIRSRNRTCFGYFLKYNRNNHSINVCAVNNAKDVMESIGTREASVWRKYSMGVLGDYHPVRGEARVGLENGDDIESGEPEA